ncbi:MAG: hypothetical protein DRH21_03580 [Deltaproteobacteria bacterium]|nr:MAG: hypothetical protein DRH21_03580 [Deltaproteobacteria bacterium]
MNFCKKSLKMRFDKLKMVTAILVVLISVYPMTDVLADSVNKSRVEVENGIPKLVVNDQVINNMFGIYIYCTGVDPSERQFLEDMKRVVDRTKDLNIPILSFDVLWADYDRSVAVPKNAEEAANRFNTENLDAVLDYAAKKKVYVIFQLLVHNHWGLPRWWKDYKNNKSGYQLIDKTSDASGIYNRLQSPVASYQSDTHRRLLQALITKLVKRYRNHPAVVGWGINPGPTGENGYAPNYIDLRFNRGLPDIDLRMAMADYSEEAVERFTQMLKRKYVNINKLNQAWESQYKSFVKVVPPFPIKPTISKTFQRNGDDRQSMRDWQTFRYEALTDEWRFLSDLVRRLDPEKIVMGKTSWVPVGTPTGTENMMATAAPVNEQHLIDADKIDVGITMQDYLPIPLWSSIIDYIHFAKFSRKHHVVRIFNMENWIKTGPTLSPGTKIPLNRSLSVKEAIRKEGAYMWLTAALDSDPEKPSWSWDEIKDLVRHSSTNELKEVRAKDTPVMFYYDVRNLMSQYYEEREDLKASKLNYHIARAFFDVEGQPEYGFISASNVAEGMLDAKTVQLLIMVNQRILLPEVVKNLSKYISDGGTVLLVGSNGVFDNLSRKDNLAIRKLAPKLTDERLQYLYNWGIQKKIQIPLIVVSGDSFHFAKIPLLGNPGDNYQILRMALSKKIVLAECGKLALVSAENLGRSDHREMKDFVRDFDRNNDGVVSEGEFFGPSEIFKHLDKNRDRKITRDEANAHHLQTISRTSFESSNMGKHDELYLKGDGPDREEDEMLRLAETPQHSSPKRNGEAPINKEGASGIVEALIPVATGVLFTDDFQGDDIDMQKYQLTPFTKREWIFLEDGALHIKGHVQRPPGIYFHIGLETRRFPTADVVAVMRMKAPTQAQSKVKDWASVLHVCNFCPDHFSEVRFGNVPGRGLVWYFASKDVEHVISEGIAAFGQERDRYYTVKVERDESTREMRGYVEAPEGWVSVGKAKDTHLYAARLELKIVTGADDLNFDVFMDDIRLYPHPDRNPVRFIITSSYPSFQYPAQGSDTIELKLFHSDGTTLIGNGKRLTVEDPFVIYISREITFPIGAVVKLYRDGREVGRGQIKAESINGLYPGDIWAISVKSPEIPNTH